MTYAAAALGIPWRSDGIQREENAFRHQVFRVWYIRRSPEGCCVAGMTLLHDDCLEAANPVGLRFTASAIAVLGLAVHRKLRDAIEIVHEMPPKDPADAENLVAEIACLCIDVIDATLRKGGLGFESPADATECVCDQLEAAPADMMRLVARLVLEWSREDFQKTMALWNRR